MTRRVDSAELETRMRALKLVGNVLTGSERVVVGAFCEEVEKGIKGGGR